MFLLNLNSSTDKSKLSSGFTSHYVPIKSCLLTLIYSTLTSFTSHYVPIKSDDDTGKTERIYIALHPIMFLLNPFGKLCDTVLKKTLHPIMFLLNQREESLCNKLITFTSHYVPIKSHTYIILYFLRFSTSFLSTPEKTSQVDVRNLLNYLLTTLLTPHESMDCQLSHKNALS